MSTLEERSNLAVLMKTVLLPKYAYLVILNLLVIFALPMSSCRPESYADGFTENTAEEDARTALSNLDYDLAVTLYSQLVSENPDQYEFYLRLATSYAGRAGIDLITIVKQQFSTDNASDNIIDSMADFVPAHPTEIQMTDIQAAITYIQLMPADHRIKGGTYAYSAEAAFTLNLYLSSSSAMLVNRYSKVDEETGKLDREALDEMSEDEVDDLFDNLESIKDSGDEELGPAVTETLDAINATEGDSQKEKLLNYLAKDSQGSSSTENSASTP